MNENKSLRPEVMMPLCRSTAAFACALSAAFVLAACQLPDPVRARVEPLLGDPVPARPADESLAAICPGDPALSAQMIEAVNAARAAQGKTLLKSEARLERVAQSHACDRASVGSAGVAGSNGSNVVDRARAAGYPTCGVTQLMAVGGTPAGVTAGWLSSQPHRVELLSQASDRIGAGVTRGPDGRLWYSVVLGEDC